MKARSVALVLHALASATLSLGNSSPALVNDQAVISMINRLPGLTWRAGANEFFDGKTVADAGRLLGTEISTSGLRLPVASHTTSGLEDFDPPSEFDARHEWQHCPTIGTIRNQGSCGGCWAFGATEALEDRFCIANAPIEGECSSASATMRSTSGCLSPQFLLDCNTAAHRTPPDGGCGGGFLDNAWEFLQAVGIPTESCDPYKECAYPPFTNCTAPGTKPKPPQKQRHQCPLSTGKCDDGSAPIKTFKAKSAYAVGTPGDVAAIQKEIMAHGPVEVAFFVFSEIGRAHV